MNKELSNAVKIKNLEDKFKNYKVNLIDPILQLPIEYPARCNFCINRNKCADLRSFLVKMQITIDKAEKDVNDNLRF
jgi:hypothetical protein